ncbi:MAG: hypothetical protein ACK4F4_07305 [Hylemonella sp.]|uniref:TipJ family phage tail tip protein n=1 Tax=Hylemonella sp. TaxID=2066020 RepID=UPI003919AF38
MKRPEPEEFMPPAMTPLRQAALVVTPHPMSALGQRVLGAAEAALVPGETLASLLQRHGVLPGRQWVVSLGGVEVPEAHWGRIRPKHGHLIEARRVPQKDALRLVAIAVISYYTLGAGGMGAGSFMGLSGAAGYIAAGVVFMAGVSVVNRYLGPKQPMLTPPALTSSSPTYSLTGGRNRVRQFEPMGLVLGEPYCVPDLAATPYTYLANGEQHLWQVLHAGINCASVRSMRIAQTPLENYQNVMLSYDGFASGNTGLALPTNVDVLTGALLDAPSAPGPWVTRTSSPNTAQLAVEIEGSVFSLNRDSGAYQALMVYMEIQYRAVGAPDWEVFYVTPPRTVVVQGHYETDLEGNTNYVPGYSYVYTPSNIEILNSSTKPVRLTFQRQVPAGQYEVRMRKLSPNTPYTNEQNTLQWTVLRSYQLDTGSYAGQARVGLQIQASGQLNGALDEVNWVGVAKSMPYWNGSSWITATDRGNGLSNPGAIILMLARGIYDPFGRLLAGLGWADERIDIEGLKTFMVWCAECNFTFDYFLQETMSIGDLLDAVAAAGLGAISFHTGKLGVIWFSDDQPIESVLNMAATKPRSFSVDYLTMPTADEIEFQYFDRDRGNTWKSLRVQAPGVTMPNSTARMPMLGITEEAHAAVVARFTMAQNIFQRKTVGCEVDLEHLTFRRGTVMAMSHDLTQWGYGGRLRAAVDDGGVVTIHLDERVPALGPGGASARYIGLRLAGEQQYRVFPVQAFSDSSRSVTLATAWPNEVPLPGDSADNPAHDCLWIYDFKSTPGQKLRVVSVEPQGNLAGARVTMAPEGPEFWTYVWSGAYQPPPNNSLLVQGPPVIQTVLVTEQLSRQGNTFYTELTASFTVTGNYVRAELWGALDGGVLQLLDRSDNTQLNWRGGLNELWLLEIRAFSNLRAATPYVLSYQVKGLSVKPPDVLDFMLDGNRLIWSEVSTPDLAGYQIRFNYGNNAWWPTAQPLHKGLLTSTPYAPSQLPLNATFLIKAFDTSGNDSQNAAQVLGPSNAPPPRNVLHTWPQSPEFSGDIVGGAVDGGVLKASATDSFYGPANASFYEQRTAPFYAEGTYTDMVYEFEVLVPEAGRLLLDYSVTASNFLIEYQRGGSASFYGAPGDSFYGPADASFYGNAPEYQTWPGYLEMNQPGLLRFRISLEAGHTRGQIVSLAALLDVPDQLISFDDFVVAPGGTRLLLDVPYHAIKTIQLTPQLDSGTGITPGYSEKNSPDGALLEVFDETKTSVGGMVDADVTYY